MGTPIRQVALLRGINLAGRRRVAMGDLRTALERAGHEDVRTVLQSGNVALTSGTDPDALAGALSATLGDAFGFEVAVVTRTRDELATVVARDPFAAQADDPARYLVSFLDAVPERARARELERAAVAPERLAVHGREVYAWHPGGIGRSELAKLVTARRLGVEVTARNWRTVKKLLELADATG